LGDFYLTKQRFNMFKNPVSFNGRIRRLEYGLSYIISIAVIVVMVLVLDAAGSMGTGIGTFFVIVIYISLLWFSFAQGAKRCHDRGNSGIWQIIPFYWMWMIFVDGEIGRNEYGENPKGLSYDSGDEEEEQINP
jgi:uncharacterized membrane protein YhaH (DUF805 family)